MRGVAAAGVLVALLAAGHASADAVQVEIYLAYWPSVGGTANEAELDRYMDCLILGTNYPQFFSKWGGAALGWGGSVGLDPLPPNDRFGACDGDVGYVDDLIQRGALPAPTQGILPLYVFMVPAGVTISSCYDAGARTCDFWPNCGQLCANSVCGLNPGETNYDISAPWLEAWVTTHASCCMTSGRTDLNLETQVIEHEVAESIANAMGGLGTCGDGCEGSTLYPFTGCPSAAGQASDWYELQSLSTVQTGSCDYEVDYTGLACAGLDEDCAADAGCCAPLACGDAGVCCAPAAALCVLPTDCCAGRSCIAGRCGAIPDAGVAGPDADSVGGPDAGSGGGRGSAHLADAGAPGSPPPGGNCSSARGTQSLLIAGWIAFELRRHRRVVRRPR